MPCRGPNLIQTAHGFPGEASAAGIIYDVTQSKAKAYAERRRGVRCVLVLRDDAGPHTSTAHCYHLRRQLEFILDPWSPSSLLIFRWLFDSARGEGKVRVNDEAMALKNCVACKLFLFLPTLNWSKKLSFYRYESHKSNHKFHTGPKTAG